MGTSLSLTDREAGAECTNAAFGSFDDERTRIGYRRMHRVGGDEDIAGDQPYRTVLCIEGYVDCTVRVEHDMRAVGQVYRTLFASTGTVIGNGLLPDLCT